MCDEQIDFMISCPHCNEIIIVEKLNCGIFRHGIHKNTFQQMDPHLSKEKCEILIHNREIFGCGKPFRVYKEGDKWIIEICEYI